MSKPRYKPWPKLKGQNVYDKERIKQIYLANPHYRFDLFCSEYKFNPTVIPNKAFPIRLWQAEWVQRQSLIQDEELMADAVSARRRILRRRLEFPDHWGDMAHNLKQIHMHMARTYATQIQDDIANEALIRKGEMRASFKLGPTGLRDFTTAAFTIQELELNSLLVPKDHKQADMIPLPERTMDDQRAEQELEELRNLPTRIIGIDPGVPPEKMTEMLAQWFDQAKMPEIAADEDPEGVSLEAAGEMLPEDE